MKKFILLSLLSAVSAWADVSTVVSPPTAVDPACVAAVTAAASATSASVTQSCPATYTVTATYTPPIVVPPLAGVQIKTKAGYCLDAATPAGVVQQACDESRSSQVFDGNVTGRYAQSGRCLGVGSSTNGTQLSMMGCTAAATLWTTPSGNVRNSGVSKCIDIPLSQVLIPGAIAQIWSCDVPTSNEQMLSTVAVGTAPPPPPPPPPPASGAQTVTFTQSNEDFLNPGRGMYITPNDTEMGNVGTLTGFVTRWNTRLFQYAPNMGAFMNSNLSAAWLSSLSSKLANARSAGVKIILLPRYQDGGTCTDSPLWKTHLQQLGVVLKANADVLADPIRAGFAGAWGEGWCSSNGLEQGGTNEAAFIAAWDAARPPTHHIAFHTYIASKYPTNPMMGAKNDCILATNTDAHNFDSLSDPRRATIGAMSKQGHPYGGETCDSTSEGNGQQRKSCAQARTELAAMGISFLNKAYSPVFLDSWTAGGCFGEISRSVGYRFFVPSINYNATTAAGQPTTVSVKVQNIGWSSNFDDRNLVVTLRNQATGALVSGPAGKLRQVAGGASATMSAVLTVPAGTYDILLSAPDPSPSIAADVRYAVRFANMDVGSARWAAPYYQTGAVLVATP